VHGRKRCSPWRPSTSTVSPCENPVCTQECRTEPQCPLYISRPRSQGAHWKPLCARWLPCQTPVGTLCCRVKNQCAQCVPRPSVFHLLHLLRSTPNTTTSPSTHTQHLRLRQPSTLIMVHLHITPTRWWQQRTRTRVLAASLRSSIRLLWLSWVYGVHSSKATSSSSSR